MSFSNPPPSETALVRREAGPAAAEDVQSQLLWLATQKRPWRSLAVVGGSAGVPTLEVANMLAKLSWLYRGQPSSVADFRELSLRLVEYQLRDLSMQLQAEPVTVVVALRSIFENPTVVPVASTVDAAILCIQIGRTSIRAARKTVDTIGRDRFIGTLAVRGHDGHVVHPGQPGQPGAPGANGVPPR